jgi:hypothetical protein
MAEKLNANDTLSKVLAYVDSPFKLFALILMAVLAFGGWILYDNKDLIVGTYKESQKLPEIAEDRVEDAVSHIFKTTGAAQSEIGLWYIEKGMRFGCRISIPPEPSRFIGQITVGWATPPADLDQTRAMLNIAATMLSRSKK